MLIENTYFTKINLFAKKLAICKIYNLEISTKKKDKTAQKVLN